MMMSIRSLFSRQVPSDNITSKVNVVDSGLGETRCHILYNPDKENYTVDFIFIHDAVANSHDAWKDPASDELWPTYLREDFSSARVLIYQYKRDWIQSLEDIVCPEHVRNLSLELLQFLDHDDYRSDVPLVVFAHGFGGLLYEQAFVLSISDPENDGRVLHKRRHAAFLFGTPHFGSGIAEWAIMVAKSYGYNCARTAEAQDWSSLTESITETATMQRAFRETLELHGSGANMTGCFSTLQEPVSKLSLSPEWAVLPEFMPIAIQRNHSSMTRLSQKDNVFNIIKIALKSVVRQLSVKRPALTTSLAERPAGEGSSEGLVGRDFTNASLAERITDSLFESAISGPVRGPKRKFLPNGYLQILLTDEIVRKELESFQRPTRDSPAGRRISRSPMVLENSQFIVMRARRFFATMVYCKIRANLIVSSINQAKTHNFDDDKLPLINLGHEPRGTWPYPFLDWSPEELAKFCEAQWIFLPPAFRSERFFSERFDENLILPLVSMDNKRKVDAFYQRQQSNTAQSQRSQVELSSRYKIVVLADEMSPRWAMKMKVCCMALPVNIVRRMVDITILDREKDPSWYVMIETSLDDYKLLEPEQNDQVRIEQLLLLE